jgi:hypothetical protein
MIVNATSVFRLCFSKTFVLTYYTSSSYYFLLLLFLVGWDWVHLVLRPLLACCTSPYDRWWWLWNNWWNANWQGKPKYLEKTRPSSTRSTTNPTWLDLGSNPGRRGGKPADNSLSYGTALHFIIPRETEVWILKLPLGSSKFMLAHSNAVIIGSGCCGTHGIIFCLANHMPRNTKAIPTERWIFGLFL